MSDALDDAAAFMALTAKIASERGFSANSYKNGCLRRRIAVRMRACGADSYGSYSGVLDRDATEYDKLIDALTINVTKLFRNAEAWEELARTVFPALWALPSALIHCWVAGCSSGEEAYTLAAMWHHFATARGETAGLTRIRITASDIDAASLESAAAGNYAPEAFVEVPAKIRERYFTPETEGRSAAVQIAEVEPEAVEGSIRRIQAELGNSQGNCKEKQREARRSRQICQPRDRAHQRQLGSEQEDLAKRKEQSC